ncbi:MAG TPA: efflux RND transporter periplasmic adaptor subunit [Candidatus Paceibacterota bacterium]
MNYGVRMKALINSRGGIAVALVVLVSGAWVWHARAMHAPAPEPQVVSVAAAVKTDIAHTELQTGILMPIREVDIAAKTGGRLTSLSVDVGDRVGSGSHIAQLDVSAALATQQSIEGSIAATEATLNATKNLYATRIASMESSDATSSDAASSQTIGASAVTNAAVLAKQIDDMTGNLLSVRDGGITSVQIPFDNELSIRDSQAKVTARNDLEAYQIDDADFQSFVASSIVGKNPSQESVNDGLGRAARTLAEGQTVLKDTYTVLSATISSTNVSDAQLDAYKAQVAGFGSQAQQMLGQMHDVTTTIATLKKEGDAQIAAAQAQLAELQGQAGVNQTILEDGSIHAPFGGVVTQKYAEEGAVVAPGTPLVHIADDSVIKIVVGVSDDVAAGVHVGDVALVTVDGVSAAVSAKVAKVSPYADPVSRKINVELDMDNTEHLLKVGSYAHVVFSQPGASSLAVPRGAVVSRYGTSFVFVLDGSIVHRRVVTTGAMSDALIEIDSGLIEGESVVTAGNDYLRDGDVVATSTP